MKAREQQEKSSTKVLKIVGVVVGVLLILGVAGFLGIHYLLGRASERATQVIEELEQPDSIPSVDEFEVPDEIREYTDIVDNKEAEEEEEVSDMPEKVSGRDTTLPVYPGSVGILSDSVITGYLTVYVAPASLEEVIQFYEEEFAGREDIEHREGPHRNNPYMEGGLYIFEMVSSDSEAMFVITLDHYEGQEDKTKVHIQGSALFFEE